MIYPTRKSYFIPTLLFCFLISNIVQSQDAKLVHCFYPPSSYATPVAQIKGDTLRFWGVVSNESNVALNNLWLEARIVDWNGVIKFQASTSLPSLPSGTLDTLTIDTFYVPSSLSLGGYKIFYEVGSDEVDTSPEDNLVETSFLITPECWAKEKGVTDDVYYSIENIEERVDANVFKTSPGWISGQFFAHEASIAVSRDPEDGPLAGENVNFVVLKVNDQIDNEWSNFDTTSGIFSNWGFTIISFSPYYFTTEGQTAYETAPLYDLDSNENGFFLEPDTRYILVALYGGESGLKTKQGYSTEFSQPDRISALLFTDVDGWSIKGYPGSPSPVLKFGEPIIVTSDEKPLTANSLTAYPNPAKDLLNLNVELEKAVKANIIIADLNGKVIQIKEYEQLGTQEEVIDLSNLANGMYLVRLATNEGSRTIKVAVQK